MHFSKVSRAIFGSLEEHLKAMDRYKSQKQPLKMSTNLSGEGLIDGGMQGAGQLFRQGCPTCGGKRGALEI